MPSQAINTLFTLSKKYQRDIFPNDYEVIVIENFSDDLLGKKAVLQLDRNFRYYLRSDNSVSPANAVNFGVKKARSDFVCVMIDGARMVTPGIVHFCIAARRLTANAIVAVPGYHIGEELQQIAIQKGYDSRVEKMLLDSIPWRTDGYRLFDIACFSGTSAGGFFNPLAESNCLAFHKKLFHKIGGYETRFDLPGGGFINLDLYKRICELPESQLFLLLGEGSFHQIHGGVSTSENYECLQEDLVPKFGEQYMQIRGHDFFAPQNTPVYLGTISNSAHRFVRLSTEIISKRIPAGPAFSEKNIEPGENL